MRITENESYRKLVRDLIGRFPDWERLNGRTLLLTGAAGMIGSLLTDTVLLRNEALAPGERCRVIASGRNRAAAEERFAPWWNRAEFTFLTHDVSLPFEEKLQADYFIHLASTTHPVAYAAEPVNTILSNLLGTRNLLELTARQPGSRMLLLSSVEIYGENRGDTEYFTEDYCGYLDCNTLRAGYPEAKRVSETLCQAYIQEQGADAVILRLPRIYGPTMRMSDTKAIAQFIRKGVMGEDVVLKSEGAQLYSYLHVADAVLAVLWTLTRGKCGEAYNAGDKRSNLTLRELAETIAADAGRKVVFERPEETERKGYSTATKALMDAGKLRSLGWAAHYDMRDGLRQTVRMLRELETEDR